MVDVGGVLDKLSSQTKVTPSKSALLGPNVHSGITAEVYVEMFESKLN